MKVKKLFLAAVILITGLSIKAQNDASYNWHRGFIIDVEQTTPYGLEINEKGELFTLTNFISKGSTLTVDYLGQTFTGVPNTATSGTRNFLLTKSDLSGNFIWGVNSNMGDVDLGSSAMVLANDGGVFLALKVRHTNRNEQGDTLLRIKDANGAEQDIIWAYSAWIYQGVLVKLDMNGALEWMKYVPVDHAPMPNASATYSTYTPEGFYFNCGATDENGNFYIAGGLRKTIYFGNDSIEAHNVDDWNGDSQGSVGGSFIVKLDNAGNYLSQFTSGGTATSDAISVLTYEDNALYASGLIRGNGSDAATFGTHSIDAPALINLFAMKLSNNLSVDWAQLYPSVRESGQNLQLRSITVKDGNVYLSGGVNGGIIFSSTGTTSDIMSNGNRLNGFILKCNASDGLCTSGAVRSSTGVGVAYGAVATADSVFHFGYDWGSSGHNIYIDAYDTDLVFGNQYGLLNGGGMTTAWDIAAYGDTVVFATRCARNNAVSFYGTSNTYTSTENWGGLITSYTFPGRTFTDIEAPSVPINLVGTATDVSITLTWTASTDNVGVSGYNVYVDDVFNQTVVGNMAVIASLTPETTYNLAVEAFDKAGNISEQADIDVITEEEIEEPDTEAPSVPMNLAGTATDVSITLTWTVSTDNVGVSGYNVYVDNVYNQTVTTNTATITGLAPETTYNLAVEAFDAAGNISEKADTDITTSETVSIADYDVNNIKIYPNPFTDYIMVDTKAEGYVSLYNIAGLQLLSRTIQEGTTQIDVSSLPNGIYILKIDSTVIKIVKQ